MKNKRYEKIIWLFLSEFPKKEISNEIFNAMSVFKFKVQIEKFMVATENAPILQT